MPVQPPEGGISLPSLHLTRRQAWGRVGVEESNKQKRQTDQLSQSKPRIHHLSSRIPKLDTCSSRELGRYGRNVYWTTFIYCYLAVQEILEYYKGFQKLPEVFKGSDEDFIKFVIWESSNLDRLASLLPTHQNVVIHPGDNVWIWNNNMGLQSNLLKTP